MIVEMVVMKQLVANNRNFSILLLSLNLLQRGDQYLSPDLSSFFRDIMVDLYVCVFQFRFCFVDSLSIFPAGETAYDRS